MLIKCSMKLIICLSEILQFIIETTVFFNQQQNSFADLKSRTTFCITFMTHKTIMTREVNNCYVTTKDRHKIADVTNESHGQYFYESVCMELYL